MHTENWGGKESNKETPPKLYGNWYSNGMNSDEIENSIEKCVVNNWIIYNTCKHGQ